MRVFHTCLASRGTIEDRLVNPVWITRLRRAIRNKEYRLDFVTAFPANVASQNCAYLLSRL